MCSIQVQDRLGVLNLQCFQSVSSVRSGFGDLPDAPIGASQLRKRDLFEVVSDIAPRIPTGLLDGALDQQGQYRDGNVRVNAVGRPMEYLQATPCVTASGTWCWPWPSVWLPLWVKSSRVPAAPPLLN